MRPRPGSTSPPASGDSDQSRVYLLVVLTEIVVICALYWLGRHFA